MTDQPRRWRFRITLRALMVVVLVVGGLLAWKANRARSQRRAVAAIKAAKGMVLYDFQYDLLNQVPKTKPNKEPSGPKWLRKLLGDEYFQEVTMVQLPEPVTTDLMSDLATLDRAVFLVINISKFNKKSFDQLTSMPDLQGLSITQSAVSDETLAELARAKRLKRLWITGANGVTDSGMSALANLPDLRSLTIMMAPKLTAAGLKNIGPALAELEMLNLYQTGLTDEGMECLDECRKLKTLALSSATIGDSGFAHFRNMESLKQLVASSTKVTDNGLAALAGLKNLQSLSLGKTAITGAGLAQLENLDKLENLMLQETEVTDEGLRAIGKLKGLKSVALSGTKVTPEAIAALKAERPTLRVVSGPITPFRRPPAPAPTAAPSAK